MASERLPKLLVGSSKEGLPVAEYFKEQLSTVVDMTLWNDNFFMPGEVAVESLEERSRQFDGALVVGTADDRVVSRGVDSASLRDNLLFEFGVFVAVFGRRRAILALEGLGSTKVPSDLFGLTCVGFTRSDPLESGLAQALVDVRRVVDSFTLDVVSAEVAGRLDDALKVFLNDLHSALGATAQVGFHVWVKDSKSTPPRLVRVARGRTSPKAPLAKSYVEGEGITGECWRTGSQVFVDFSQEPYRSVNQTTWESFGPVATKGMDFQSLEVSRERHRAVGATPIVSSLSSGAEFLGCLSYNIGPNVDAFDFKADMRTVENVLDKAVEVMRIILEAGD
jgi:hypothetical protein